jgi:F-type H+-transporting ATPase subunit alpha
VELLKQGQYEPLPVEKQILIIYAGTNGFVDELPLTALKKYEQELYSFVDSKHSDLFADILKKRELDGDLRAKLNKALEEFKAVFRH